MSQATRMTKQRALILQELRSLKTHPTADEIHALVRKKMPHISLGTVYRNLDLLAAGNEILKLEYAGFQKRFDGCIKEHQHVRCTCCGKVGDVEPPLEAPEGAAKKVCADGFNITGARLEFFGLCAECCREISMESKAS